MISVLGGYGEVGTAAVRALLALGLGPLRIGGRDGAAARALVRTLDAPSLEAAEADFMDRSSLARFVSGCRVLLNCAGPSHLIGAGPALVALEEGADYVDVAGDDGLYALLDDADYREQGCRALLSAGLQPGLTGLLPRWLAATGFDKVSRLVSYFGLLDHFTAVAADDYLQSVEDGFGRPLAAWRQGCRPGVLVRNSDAGLPFFPGRVTALPYLNREAERIASSLELEQGDWYTVVAGRHTLAALDWVHGMSREGAASLLQRSSRLDMAGRTPFVTLLVQLGGRVVSGEQRTRSLAFRGHRNSELTGAFAAVVTRAALEQNILPGRQFAAMSVEPVSAVESLLATGMVSGLTVLDGPLEMFTEAEEGAL
ncbi:saccharopine dehydrogenase NADP-binding domain-containing protein [Nitrococcus mobilis]|uniref:Saccharopine dehydrogenase NADP binding domain-containing protein n=1 Tax=Nitrococcus mobilis Nb-231 TaxID=314278 RepID=A4BLS5_9GAMM|nr:saccharopine dehydrogenase NADP-binding domain-containing protein [Nitrococcus mobilis]EAR23263.1 hypothetical protein NB231_15623 [Nitrococcus mobilis Nb-231]